MTPTKEQIQWFWEQCGFKLHAKKSAVIPNFVSYKWEYPDGSVRVISPPIDLNNLFKYAVLEINKRGLRIRLINQPVGRNTFFYAIGGKWLPHKWAEDKDPALALFWALYKALGGKDG